jgi:hypothetical protein
MQVMSTIIQLGSGGGSMVAREVVIILVIGAMIVITFSRRTPWSQLVSYISFFFYED